MRRIEAVDIIKLGELGWGRKGREVGGCEVEVPHLLATPSNDLDQTTAGLTIQISHCIIQISPNLNSKQMLPVLASPMHLPPLPNS